MIETFCWLTDIHINFLSLEDRQKFYAQITADHCDAVVITGDIAEAHNLSKLLTEMAEYCQRPIYFVLGNHDFYRGSVASVRDEMKQLCKERPSLVYLPLSGVIALNDHTALIGQDGWADARFGDYDHSRVVLNDSKLIAELMQANLLNHNELRRAMQGLADDDAAAMKQLLNEVGNQYPRVYIATHIPPFEEACWHIDAPSDPEWMPFFSSKAMGDVILAAAKQHPDVHFHVLCGHTHTPKDVEYLPNLRISAGHSEYYYPEVQRVFDL